MAARIVANMSNKEYHDYPAIGSSGLKLLERSPFHYWSAYVDPDRERKEPTPMMKLGTYVHCAILEPQEFDNRYTVVPDGVSKTTKEGKAFYKEIEESGKEGISHETWRKIQKMAVSAMSLMPSRVLFGQDFICEASFFWTDELTGAECKFRPDYHLPPCELFPNGLIMDVKTCPDAAPEGFAKNAWNSDMHLQAAHYTQGFCAYYGTTPEFMWLAVENDSPHASKYHAATRAHVEYGDKQVSRLLALYKDCVDADEWPSYNQEVEPLALPSWAEKIVEKELSN